MRLSLKILAHNSINSFVYEPDGYKTPAAEGRLADRETAERKSTASLFCCSSFAQHFQEASPPEAAELQRRWDSTGAGGRWWLLTGEPGNSEKWETRYAGGARWKFLDNIIFKSFEKSFYGMQLLKWLFYILGFIFSATFSLCWLLV